MDPENIKLTTSQKIVPLIKAINKEIPWQVILITIPAISAWIMVPLYIPVLSVEHYILDFLARRLLMGFITAAATFFFCGFTLMFVEEKLVPIFTAIKEHYEEEALAVKKKVLDDVIDDEILRK